MLVAPVRFQPSCAMTPDDLLAQVSARYPGSVLVTTWGERSVFYNPERALPKGVYFLTVKERDGPNDRASMLDRSGVYRVNLGLGAAAYEERFGPRPARPPKGGVVDTGHDFTAVDVLLPHPVYAWMGWACVLSPSAATWAGLASAVDVAHAQAVARFEQRMRRR